MTVKRYAAGLAARSAPINCSAHLTPFADGAKEWGYATFNEAEHLCVSLPDHPVTITTRDSLGRTLTVYFGNYTTGPDAKSPPTFIDIQASSSVRQPGRDELPGFEIVGFGPGNGDVFDTRDHARSPSLATILLDGTPHAAKTGKALPSARRLNHRLTGAVEALRACVDALTPPRNTEEEEALAKAQAALDAATA